MKANIGTILVGSKVVLVPYRPEHVPKYHSWMLSEELRSLTASEPLTLEEEYEMQQKWQFDEDKLTFIILARDRHVNEVTSPQDPILNDLQMIGDVNIFLSGSLAELRTDTAEGVEDDECHGAEVEIMIAEPEYRRRGCAIEALHLMLTYATGKPSAFSAPPPPPALTIDSPLKISPCRLLTRISETNIASIALFQKLGFQVTKRVEVFGEVEMRW